MDIWFMTCKEYDWICRNPWWGLAWKTPKPHRSQLYHVYPMANQKGQNQAIGYICEM